MKNERECFETIYKIERCLKCTGDATRVKIFQRRGSGVPEERYTIQNCCRTTTLVDAI